MQYTFRSPLHDLEIAMVRTVVLAALVALGFLAASAQAQTLPLSDNLIDLRSNEGEQLLRHAVLLLRSVQRDLEKRPVLWPFPGFSGW